MRSDTARLVRRLAVALFVFACISLVAWRAPALPSIPTMMGLVPEPAATPAAAPAPTFQPVDGSGPAPITVTQRPGNRPARTQATRPPRPRRTGADTAGGAPLPTLPPDEIPRGRYHRVEAGETAGAIAGAYGLSSQWPIYDANPIMVDPDEPPVGAWLYIPHPSTSPQPRPRPGQPGYSDTPNPTVIVDGIWLQLAQCESSGDWSINTGNNYYGGLQFTLSSWKAVGGAGYPHEAHPMEQIARADYLQRIQGWRAWPMCAGKLGLIPQDEAAAIVRRARAGQSSEQGGQATEPANRAAPTEDGKG
jgi:hypothetical protein